ncbi:MAG: 16S rRNA (guanine(966)-N(2))-methyltransferase RsmD [Magnetococcales bacterium]|nr:16S rRNA (guanine(966)-N(2))-methyltransferase RsmD [Magnetococcales bacterium]
MVKISAGKCRGRVLATPTDDLVRPTTGRVKEALFSMIAPFVTDAVVLDLFAGSGNLGLEALSRGAKRSVFVDNNQKSIALIRENIKRCGFIDQSDVVFGSAIQIKTLEILAVKQPDTNFGTGCFNLVFLDPPYDRGLIQKSLDLLISSQLLAADTVIVTEEKEHVIVTLPIGWALIQTRRYGESRISIWTNRIPVEPGNGGWMEEPSSAHQG